MGITWSDASALADNGKDVELYQRAADQAFELDPLLQVQQPWFQPIHMSGKTHFPTLESPVEAAASIISLSGAGHARLG